MEKVVRNYEGMGRGRPVASVYAAELCSFKRGVSYE